MGGIATAQDVIEFLSCGARDVALGTVLFADPDAPKRIRDELAVVQLDDASLDAKLVDFRAHALA
jgi:dihydroorotate dehydrogenase